MSLYSLNIGSCLAVDQTVMELRRVNNNLEGIKSLLTVSIFNVSFGLDPAKTFLTPSPREVVKKRIIQADRA